MAGVYIDTSALGRVLLGEPDAESIRNALAGYGAWWSNALLVVELRRLARREGFEQAAERALGHISLLDVDRTVLDRASWLDPVDVRSLDAIHLDAAVVLAGRGEIATVMTYDRQLEAGCAHHNLDVDAPAER
jgi:predicted nucleic acid-binding protein